ncbi:serine protease grass-like [Zophobas morio]|uniref:serine protease grass-like n=1 Tax=Zophobas morio TaxID=2755281 RepID=UPI003082EE30
MTRLSERKNVLQTTSKEDLIPVIIASLETPFFLIVDLMYPLGGGHTTGTRKQYQFSKNPLSKDPTCGPPHRTGTCTLITECPYFMNLIGHANLKSVPGPVLHQVKTNMCGELDQTYKVCCPEDNRNLSSHRNFHLLPLTTCGFILHGGRITNGDTATPREFPWMALIAYKTEDENEFKCGGSLITRNYVLTAAHCVDDKSVLGIRLGEYDISLEHEYKIIIHKNYNPSTYINDIALVRLLAPANTENANVKPICLPTGDLLKANLVGKYLTLTGWGITESGHKSMILKKVSVPVVRLSACRRAYGKQTLHPKKQICAGGHDSGFLNYGG